MARYSSLTQETFHRRLRRQYPQHFEFSVSYTTRKKRDGEDEGINYFFVTREEFEKVLYNYKKIAENDFIEHVEFAGNYYGTSRSFLEQIRKKGKV